ncbi:cAMP-dependent protein kinase inhibitor gamma [Ambystoma mexicanum]|uniref:cAMP-dependent protein kinase inhibitor gamma n=1 Tax=Ambystoma mexicanum TaxID=8296 RepID=UPI0037E74354
MEVETAYTDFISCDRTGRRNAVPDIKGEPTSGSMRELTGDMGDLAIQGETQEGATGANPGPVERPEGQDSSSAS